MKSYFLHFSLENQYDNKVRKIKTFIIPSSPDSCCNTLESIPLDVFWTCVYILDITFSLSLHSVSGLGEKVWKMCRKGRANDGVSERR